MSSSLSLSFHKTQTPLDRPVDLAWRIKMLHQCAARPLHWPSVCLLSFAKWRRQALLMPSCVLSWTEPQRCRSVWNSRLWLISRKRHLTQSEEMQMQKFLAHAHLRKAAAGLPVQEGRISVASWYKSSFQKIRKVMCGEWWPNTCKAAPLWVELFMNNTKL